MMATLDSHEEEPPARHARKPGGAATAKHKKA
jgi:hypothetical protein